MLLVESISNPLMEVGDLEAVVAFAREHDLVTMIDNTFASPVNFRPLEIGIDLVFHSATKYLNGHSDVVAGAVISSAANVDKVRHLLLHLGGSIDPNTAFLFERGHEDPGAPGGAPERQRRAAGRATWHRATTWGSVNYPGLPRRPRTTP